MITLRSKPISCFILRINFQESSLKGFSTFNSSSIINCFLHLLQILIFSKKDCDDSSDEKNCRTVSFDDEKYLKNKPPPPPKGMDKLPVTARFACLILTRILI